jgi:hypothetical protein
MTAPQPPPVDPQCPDGPEPHPFPAWPYALEKVLALPDGLPSASAPLAPSTDRIGDAYRMMAAPYTALWSTYAAGFQAWANLWTAPPRSEPAPAASPRAAAKPRPAPRKRPPRKT